MKNLFTALLIGGAFYFSACTKATPYSEYVVQKKDSTTNNGYLHIAFSNKDITMKHLNVLKLPVHSLVSVTKSFDQADTLYTTQIQVMDHKSQIVAMDLTLYNNTSGTEVGTYYVTKNNCTFTDFANGQNVVYQVNIGGSVNITQTGQTTIGTFNFVLYYNHIAYPATGDFVINNF